MGKTTIEWTDQTWNPVTGCTKVSPGCDHCYAETIAHRFAGTKAYPHGFDVTLHPERMDQPLHWRKPRRVFVNSMSDLFHKDIPDEYIARVWAVMQLAPEHTFQILTKRPGRMRSLLSSHAFIRDVDDVRERQRPGCGDFTMPLPNVWLGVSVEDQKWADVRIPLLLATPAAVRFISAEPLLGPVDLRRFVVDLQDADNDAPWARDWQHGIDWVIAGGESGPGARPMHPDWAISLRDQCVSAGVPFLFKQWGAWSPTAPLKGGVFQFHGAHPLANDGTLYAPGDLAYPDGPRYGEALRADHGRAHLTHMYRVGKTAAGRELDDRTWDEYPVAS